MKYMNITTRQSNEKLLELIEDSRLRALRERTFIKSKILFEYLRPPETPAAAFDVWRDEFEKASALFVRHDDPLISRDEDGDVVLAQPYAEKFVLSGAHNFGGALALILMAETCYEPTLGDPSRLNQVFLRHMRLVKRGAHVSAAELHEFLEVDDPIPRWLSGQLRRHLLVPGRDYVRVPEMDTYYADDSMMPIMLRPGVLGRVAAATTTLRGRKMRACLFKPGVWPRDLANNDPALLQLLFTPPTRGLASL